MNALRGWAWSILIVLLAWSQPGSALDRDIAIPQFQQTVWTAKDGTPSQTWAMAQTSDGWMWFGAVGGLYRFDGIRFERMAGSPSSADRSDAVSALHAAATGELLIGYLRGGISVLKDGQFTHHRDPSVMGRETVFALAKDRSGALWASTRDRLLRFDGTQWHRVGQEWNYPDGYSHAMLVDRRGVLWVASKEQLLSLADGSRRFEPRLRIDTHGDLVESPDGRVWHSSEHALRVVPGQQASTDGSVGISTSQTSFISMFDRDGAFWVLSDAGLGRVAYPERLANGPSPAASAAAIDPEAAAVFEPGSPGKDATTMLEDRDGNIWVVHAGTIVRRFRNVSVVRLIPNPGESWPLVGSFGSSRSGHLWVSARNSLTVPNSGDGLWKIDGGRLVQLHAKKLTATMAAHEDGRGNLWIAGNDALWREAGGTLQKDLPYPDAWRLFPAIAMAVDAEGKPWLSILSTGLFRRGASGWERNGNIDTLPQEPPNCSVVSDDGILWLGYADGTVITVDRGSSKIVIGASGSVGSVGAISVRRIPLIAGERGLIVVHEGKPLLLVGDEPSSLEEISGIVELDDGDVWLNSRRGAVRIRLESIRSAIAQGTGRVQTESFDSADGYPGQGGIRSVAGNRMARSSDGRVFVIGTDGFASIDPKRIRKSTVAPRPIIRALTTDAGRVEPAHMLALAAGTRSMRIDYTGLSHSHPERQTFRYRLSGVDEAWIEAGARREAFYTNLGEGSYRFELLAANENGVWSSTPATLNFEIAPTFVQTWPFRIACIFAAVTLLVVFVRWRLRQLVARERVRLDDRLRERERIARELHDTLLQGTQGFVLKVQVAANLVDSESPVRQMLDSALTNAHQVMIEGRDRIQHLRTLGVEANDLPEAVQRLGQGLAHGDGTRFSFQLDGDARAMNVNVADEVYQIARESLTNAFRHSNARMVEARLVYGTDMFRLQVRDDGRGFDPQDKGNGRAMGSWGLTGMRERAEAIGASLFIRSRAGVGTEVELQIRPTFAYA